MRLEDELVKKIDIICENYGVTRSKIIKDAIEEYLSNQNDPRRYQDQIDQIVQEVDELKKKLAIFESSLAQLLLQGEKKGEEGMRSND